MILSRTPPWLGALLLIGIAFTARAILDPLLGDRSPFLFFTLVVLIAGARFGVLVGVAVAAASTVLGTWAFLPPRYAFGTMTSNEWTNVVAFCVTSVAMLIFVDKLTKSRASEAARVAENRTVGDQLRQSEQRLASIVNSAMDAIVTIDDAQLIALFNPAAERMFGYSASAVLGEPITKLIPERFRDGHHAHVQAFRKEGVTSRRLDSLGTIYGMRASGEEFPIEASISHVVVDDQNLTTVILRDTTERTLNEEKQTLLAREVDHRAKNALAVAQALVSLTRGETIEEYTAAVTGRISSLARAHSLLSRSQWAGAALRDIVKDEVTPYAREGQLVLFGPEVTLVAEAVQPMSLVFHELATNALKHGALSSETGMIELRSRSTKECLALTWKESGGPTVRQPSRSGFGSKLLQKTVARQLEGKLEYDWEPDGLAVKISIPPRLFSAPETLRPGRAATFNAEPVALDGAGRQVLVVEDEELIALGLCNALQEFGWEVLGPAATISEGEDLIRAHPALSAAVLDVNLRGRPVYPLAETLTKANIPFIFSTGYEVVDPEGRFRNVPVIRKPATRRAVASALQRLLDEKQGAMEMPVTC